MFLGHLFRLEWRATLRYFAVSTLIQHLIVYHCKIKKFISLSSTGPPTVVPRWGAYIDIKLLTSLFKGFIGSEEIVYKHKQEVGRFLHGLGTVYVVSIMRSRRTYRSIVAFSIAQLRNFVYQAELGTFVHPSSARSTNFPECRAI